MIGSDGEGGEPGVEAQTEPYGTLGVPSDASEQDITNAYRRLARAHHPDSNPEGRPAAFTAVTDAYDLLQDPERRRAYDATRSTRAAAAHAAAGVRIPVRRGPARPDAQGAPPGRAAGRLDEVELPLTFDQAALGTIAVIEVTTSSRCGTCDGSGRGPTSPCPACNGLGHEARRSGGITIRHACGHCDGTGRTRPVPCDACRGRGEIDDRRDVKLRVPPGVDDGARLRFTVPGERPREMRAVVRTSPHRFFARRGRDITLRLPITLAEAALGGVVTVPTLRNAVPMRVPPGTPSGRTFRIRGEGVPHPDQPGDLLVTVDVVIPHDLNDAQRAALEAFAAATASPRSQFERPTSA